MDNNSLEKMRWTSAGVTYKFSTQPTSAAVVRNASMITTSSAKTQSVPLVSVVKNRKAAQKSMYAHTMPLLTPLDSSIGLALTLLKSVESKIFTCLKTTVLLRRLGPVATTAKISLVTRCAATDLSSLQPLENSIRSGSSYRQMRMFKST